MHWVVSLLLSYILRYVSFTEVGNVYRVALREPMHLCTRVNEEGDDGEAACSEMPSLPSYTLRYVSFTEVVSVCRVVLREPIHLCASERQKYYTLLQLVQGGHPLPCSTIQYGQVQKDIGLSCPTREKLPDGPPP
jgi:hypothetical protein